MKRKNFFIVLVTAVFLASVGSAFWFGPLIHDRLLWSFATEGLIYNQSAGVAATRYVENELTEKTPAWVLESVFYEIFPDRFHRSGRVKANRQIETWESSPSGDGFKGGDLYGVAEGLGYLKQLGISAIYLTPIFKSETNHRYSTQAYDQVDPLLGGNKAFHFLLKRAHQLGIRVVLDAVFHHTGTGFFAFEDLLKNQAASRYREWYLVHQFPIPRVEDTAREIGFPFYESFYDYPYLPKLNLSNEAVRKYILEVLKIWTRRGVDGWRFDVAQHMREPQLWKAIRSELTAIKPDIYLVAEVGGPGEYDPDHDLLKGGQVHGAMNYAIRDLILETVKFANNEFPNLSPQEAARKTASLAMRFERLAHHQKWGIELGHLNLLASHDSPRAFTMLGSDSTNAGLAYALLFMFPGAPMVYYGGELDYEGWHDPLCRGPFDLQGAEELTHPRQKQIQMFAGLRRKEPALQFGRFSVTVQAPGLMTIVRSRKGEKFELSINLGAEARLLERSTADLVWSSQNARSPLMPLQCMLTFEKEVNLDR